MAFLIKFSSKELRKRPSFGYFTRPLLSQASSYIVLWLPQKTLSGKTHTFRPWALSASLRPTHLPNGVSTKAAESSKSALSNFSLLAGHGNSRGLCAGGSEFMGYPISPRLDLVAVSHRPENFLGFRHSSPTEFSNILGLAFHLMMSWTASFFSPYIWLWEIIRE